MIGLKCGTVALYPHDPVWEENARKTIAALKEILESSAFDIQHVGSTAIKNIKAKPIIDIAVAAESFDDILAKIPELEQTGFFYRENSLPGQLLFSCGDYNTGGCMQTHFIHVVKKDGEDWRNYLNFRDYLNATPSAAKQYENLKISLCEECGTDSGREKYLAGKAPLVRYLLRKALVWSYLGKTVDVEIDRPVGYIHRKKNYTLNYPINYGFIPGVLGGDGEELDVYILGVSKPLERFRGRVIGIAHRENDVEDKLIAAPEEMTFTLDEVSAAVAFQEQHYQGRIELFSGGEG